MAGVLIAVKPVGKGEWRFAGLSKYDAILAGGLGNHFEPHGPAVTAGFAVERPSAGGSNDVETGGAGGLNSVALRGPR